MSVRRVSKGGARRAANEEELAGARVDPDRAEAAYDGHAVLQGETLMSEDEERASLQRQRRRDKPSLARLIASLNVGALLCAAAFVFFQEPNNFAIGGASGFSIVLSTLVPVLPADVSLWIVNVALVAVGLVLVERRAVFWSVVASLAIPAYASLLQALAPAAGSLTGDMWMDLCCTVLLVALGNAVAYNAGASTGGTEIIVMALTRHTSLPVGHAVAAANAVVVCAGMALYGVRIGVYCIVGLVLQTVVVNAVLGDLKQHKVCTVICRKPARVEEFVVRELQRTATISYGYGAYSGRRVAQVMTVLTRAEALKLQRYVRSLDENAFITYVSTSEITGRGFRWV